MRKKTLATTLTIVGAVLTVVSTVNLFLILVGGSSYEYFVMASKSMEPAIGEGEVSKVKLGVKAYEIYAAPKDANPPGDIIAFRKPTNPDDVLVHRAIESGTDTSYYLITKGDSNPAPDGWRVRETDIIGKVVEINPPIWTYNYVFCGVILSIGIAVMLGGVVVRKTKRIEVHRADHAMKPEAGAGPAIVEREPKRKFFCRYCGAENKSDAVFCERCGKRIG